MALVAVPPFYYPSRMGLEGVGSPTSITGALLNASGEKLGWTLVAPKTGTISKIGFRTTTVTTADDLDCRIETIDTSGNPSGTLWAANTNATQVLVDTNDNIWFWVTLTAGAVVTKGDYFAVVVAITFVDGNLNVALYITNNLGNAVGVPGAGEFTTGAWVWAATGGSPIVAVEYSDGSRPWLDGTLPIASGSSQVTNYSIDTTSTPDEVGLRFTVPFACKISGARVRVSSGGTTTFAVKLYDATDTVLASKTGVDADLDHGATATGISVYFSSEVALAVNAVYRLTVLPEVAAVALFPYYVNIDSAATMEVIGGGTSMYATERTDAGAWTDTNTRRLFMGLILSALDNGTPEVNIQSPMIGGRIGVVSY